MLLEIVISLTITKYHKNINKNNNMIKMMTMMMTTDNAITVKDIQSYGVRDALKVITKLFYYYHYCYYYHYHYN